MQFHQFLQKLLERIRMEIFYQHDIGLEDNSSLNIEELLKNALIIIK